MHIGPERYVFATSEQVALPCLQVAFYRWQQPPGGQCQGNNYGLQIKLKRQACHVFREKCVTLQPK